MARSVRSPRRISRHSAYSSAGCATSFQQRLADERLGRLEQPCSRRVSSDAIMRGEPDMRPRAGQDAHHEHARPPRSSRLLRNASSASPRRRPRRCTCSKRTGASSAFPASPCARRGRGGRSRRCRRSRAPRSTASASCSRTWCSVLGPAGRHRRRAGAARAGRARVQSREGCGASSRMIRVLGGMIGCQAKAATLCDAARRESRARSVPRPRSSSVGRASTSRNGTSR